MTTFHFDNCFFDNTEVAMSAIISSRRFADPDSNEDADTEPRVSALVDNRTGVVWYTGSADTPEGTCSTVAEVVSHYQARFQFTDLLRPGQPGYLLYDASALLFQVEDPVELREKAPFVGGYRPLLH